MALHLEEEMVLPPPALAVFKQGALLVLAPGSIDQALKGRVVVGVGGVARVAHSNTWQRTVG
jgi:hypothetical protein